MQAFIDFLVNNYFWFLVISLILIFALIGYLVDTNDKQQKLNLQNDDPVEEPVSSILEEKNNNAVNIEVLEEEKK